MKKTLLALLISSSLFLTACDDKESNQQLLDAKKMLVQLEEQLQTSQDELAKKSLELTALQAVKAENVQLKAQISQKSADFPALKVVYDELFARRENLKFEKKSEEEYVPEEGFVEVSGSMLKTGVAWLDKLLLDELAKFHFTEEELAKQKNITAETLKASLQTMFENDLKSIKEVPMIGSSYNVGGSYLGQRNNIATFSLWNDVYSGGAHGMSAVKYLVVDTDKKALITLNDLVKPKNQEKLKEILWQNYHTQFTDSEGKFEMDGFANKKDFRVPDNFYFTSPMVLNFVYDVYELGPYAVGNVEVSVGLDEIKEFMNPDYFPTKERDGNQAVEAE